MTLNKKDMEKSGIIMLVAGMVALAACTLGHHHHTTVVEKSNWNHANVSFLIDPMALFDCRNSSNKKLSFF